MASEGSLGAAYTYTCMHESKAEERRTRQQLLQNFGVLVERLLVLNLHCFSPLSDSSFPPSTFGRA